MRNRVSPSGLGSFFHRSWESQLRPTLLSKYCFSYFSFFVAALVVWQEFSFEELISANKAKAFLNSLEYFLLNESLRGSHHGHSACRLHRQTLMSSTFAFATMARCCLSAKNLFSPIRGHPVSAPVRSSWCLQRTRSLSVKVRLASLLPGLYWWTVLGYLGNSSTSHLRFAILRYRTAFAGFASAGTGFLRRVADSKSLMFLWGSDCSCFMLVRSLSGFSYCRVMSSFSLLLFARASHFQVRFEDNSWGRIARLAAVSGKRQAWSTRSFSDGLV